MSDYPDNKILDLCRNKDSGNYGFNLLVRKYQKQIYWHIRRMVVDHDDTDDIVQNTFIKVWKNINNFREDSKLYTWIYRIATNEALSFLKNKRKKYFLPIADVEYQLSQSLTDDNYFSGDEIQLKLQKALLKLPNKQRLVFNMKYYDEMKYEDMSEVLGTSVGALKASYHIAVKKIENYIKDN
ncbi:MAG: sigma-70 family RNA polymerase sigma factor [Bacteroidales bacterium]|nr:sigma-70 family RNA polymerase sigma factor [Bacteroidales bacterium]